MCDCPQAGFVYGNYWAIVTHGPGHRSRRTFLHRAPPFSEDYMRRIPYVDTLSLVKTEAFPGKEGQQRELSTVLGPLVITHTLYLFLLYRQALMSLSTRSKTTTCGSRRWRMAILERYLGGEELTFTSFTSTMESHHSCVPKACLILSRQVDAARASI